QVRKHGLRVWKRMVGFGRRWAVETAIGSFKAMFGESVMTRTVEAAQLEVGLKVAVYNRLCQNRPRNQGRGRGRTATKRERNNYATKQMTGKTFISKGKK
ncbi:MAG: hypothetical protein ACTSRF_02500, partial [Candidatus Freyarchaeota archaeon]